MLNLDVRGTHHTGRTAMLTDEHGEQWLTAQEMDAYLKAYLNSKVAKIHQKFGRITIRNNREEWA